MLNGGCVSADSVIGCRGDFWHADPGTWASLALVASAVVRFQSKRCGDIKMVKKLAKLQEFVRASS